VEFDLRTLLPRARYKLLAGSIVPRPIALISSLSGEGRANLAPFAFFQLVSYDPDLVVNGFGRRPDGEPRNTLANIRATGEYVINLVDEAMIEQMNVCAVDFPEDVDELAVSGFTPEPSRSVGPVRVAESPVALECKLVQELTFGSHTIVIGEVGWCRIRDDLVDDQHRIDQGRLNVIARLGGAEYARGWSRFEMPLMSYVEWSSRQETREI
jgi:flavin reductase (DIM6/NTAB) family NADH-FMN oxidoreductase RutF